LPRRELIEKRRLACKAAAGGAATNRLRSMRTILLLIGSNVFMTCAWYGHLKYRASPLWIVVLASWAIAFFEYCLQVPANRIGYGEFSAGQLKIIQEVITLIVFAGFATLYLGDPITWRYAGAFVCLLGAVGFMFVGRPG
jgi:hypothetical protein